MFQFYHKFLPHISPQTTIFFYHKPLPLSPHPPTMFSVAKINTGESVDRSVKILRGLQIFDKNIRAGAAGVVQTLWFKISDVPWFREKFRKNQISLG